jgi:hypothetical protein
MLFGTSGGGEDELLKPGPTGTTTAEQLADLVYELLDAHCDTIRLTGELERSETWAAHLDYLRDLQRVGRETLARI